MQALEHGESAPDKQDRAPVFLHIYDLPPKTWNQAQYILSGTSIFHAGVEVHGKEWMYGAMMGIEGIKPKSIKVNGNFIAPREAIALGLTKLSADQVEERIKAMKATWRGEDYNVLSRNCCSFARALLQELDAEQMPGWVDRAARRGVESCAATGVQAAGVGGLHLLLTGPAASAGPAGWAALGGELVFGRIGALVGENVDGDDGKRIGQHIGGAGGSVGTAAAVGAVVAGPIGAAVGAGIGCASFAVGKLATMAVRETEPNRQVTKAVVATFPSLRDGLGRKRSQRPPVSFESETPSELPSELSDASSELSEDLYDASDVAPMR